MGFRLILWCANASPRKGRHRGSTALGGPGGEVALGTVAPAAMPKSVVTTRSLPGAKAERPYNLTAEAGAGEEAGILFSIRSTIYY